MRIMSFVVRMVYYIGKIDTHRSPKLLGVAAERSSEDLLKIR